MHMIDGTSPLLRKYKNLAPKQHNNMEGLDTNRIKGLFANSM